MTTHKQDAVFQFYIPACRACINTHHTAMLTNKQFYILVILQTPVTSLVLFYLTFLQPEHWNSLDIYLKLRKTQYPQFESGVIHFKTLAFYIQKVIATTFAIEKTVIRCLSAMKTMSTCRTKIKCFDEFYIDVFLLMYFIIFLLETIYVCSTDH